MYLKTVPPALPRLNLSAYRDLPPLVLDLGEVEALTAAGLGELVGLHMRLGNSGGRLVLVNVGARAYEALETTGLTRLLEVRRARIVRLASDEMLDWEESIEELSGKT